MVKAEKNPEGYRATEAGILPIDWQVKRLSEIATELTERAGQDMYETVSISAGIGSVSYTHLDVYKRQLYVLYSRFQRYSPAAVTLL